MTAYQHRIPKEASRSAPKASSLLLSELSASTPWQTGQPWPTRPVFPFQFCCPWVLSPHPSPAPPQARPAQGPAPGPALPSPPHSLVNFVLHLHPPWVWRAFVILGPLKLTEVRGFWGFEGQVDLTLFVHTNFNLLGVWGEIQEGTARTSLRLLVTSKAFMILNSNATSCSSPSWQPAPHGRWGSLGQPACFPTSSATLGCCLPSPSPAQPRPAPAPLTC